MRFTIAKHDEPHTSITCLYLPLLSRVLPPPSILPMTYHTIPISLRQTTISPYRTSLSASTTLPPHLHPFPPYPSVRPILLLHPQLIFHFFWQCICLRTTFFFSWPHRSPPPQPSQGYPTSSQEHSRNQQLCSFLFQKINELMVASLLLPCTTPNLLLTCHIHKWRPRIVFFYHLDALMRPNVYLPGVRRTRSGSKTFSTFPTAAKWKYTNGRSPIPFISAHSLVCLFFKG